MEEYLLTIYVFVYLCVKFKFRYLRSNTHISVLIIKTLRFYFCLHSSFLRKINSLYLPPYVFYANILISYSV
jgi:hypothetical protein